MASRNSLQRNVWKCTRSLCRPSNSRPTSILLIQQAAFSTSSKLPYPMPAKKKGGEQKNVKGQKQLKLGKDRSSMSDAPRGPSAAERKALKKRIVLSNTNALVVDQLQTLDQELVESREISGTIVRLADPTIDQLRAVEAFKTTQGWKHYRSPSVMMTEESMTMLQWMNEIDANADAATVRKVVVGDRSSGKSTLLLQAMAAAFLKGWVVVNIPDGNDLVSALTEYAPLPGTTPTQYVQRNYMSTLLSQMDKANNRLFNKLTVKQTHSSLPIPIQKDTTLSRLCSIGSTTPDLAWPLFLVIWKELTAKSSRTPPILLAADGLGHLMRPSAYLDPNLKPIHAHDLAIVQHFTQHLSGAASLPNGGLVLAATSESNVPDVPSMDHSLLVAEARQNGQVMDPWDPYRPADPRVSHVLRDVGVLRMRGLSRSATRTVLEYYARSGLMQHAVDNKFVGEKWTMSGGGNIGELEKAVVVMGAARI